MDLPASLLPINIQQQSMDLDMELYQNVSMKRPLSLFNRFLNLQSLKIHDIIDKNELDLSAVQAWAGQSCIPDSLQRLKAANTMRQRAPCVLCDGHH